MVQKHIPGFHFLRSDKGAAAVEAVFIFPFLFLVYFGLQDLTALINYTRKLTMVSATISDNIAQYPTTVTSAQATDVMNVVPIIMQPTPSNYIHVDVYDFYMNGGTATERWRVQNSGSATCTAPTPANYTNLMSAGNDIVVAVSCYKYQPYVTQLMGQNVIGATSFLLNETIASSPRGGKTLTCTNTTGTVTCGM